MLNFDEEARAALDRVEGRDRPVRIAVIGDIMLDRFVYGTVERISPEVPVPVVEVDREVHRLGGAANVVSNLNALGAQAELVGVVGRDRAAEELRAQLGALGVPADGLLEAEDRPTAVKTRVIAQHQQVVRFDRERNGPLPDVVLAAVLHHVERRAPDLDGWVVSDYGKGVVGAALMGRLLALARETGAMVAVDPKPANVRHYRGVGVVTPNTKEIEAMVGFGARSDAEAQAAGRKLLSDLGSQAVLVTRGERGMTLVERAGDVTQIPTRARDVFDVTGAGDTAISVLSLAWAAGARLVEAACLANLASGIVVGKLGTAVVTPQELRGAVTHGVPAAARHRPA